MGSAEILEQLADSAINSIPLLGVCLWAWLRSRRLSGPNAPHRRRIRAVIFTLIAMTFAFPLAFRAFVVGLPLESTASVVARAGLGIVLSIAHAACWFTLFRSVFDLSAPRRPGENRG